MLILLYLATVNIYCCSRKQLTAGYTVCNLHLMSWKQLKRQRHSVEAILYLSQQYLLMILNMMHMSTRKDLRNRYDTGNIVV